jgi:toxin FitB
LSIPSSLASCGTAFFLLPRGKRRTRLERWFDGGVERLHCLPWEAATGLRWAQLIADLRKSGRAMPIKDSLIAATALVHGLTVATRNRSDFQKAGVKMVDPFAAK